ncbi:MAG TPA: hypothetical protein VGS10_02935, partial [Terracidiphilus sp.]|nr:hypothetical protein [Terracidiphilus sp.]
MMKRAAVWAILIALAAGQSAAAQRILSPDQARGKRLLMVVGTPDPGETNDDGLIRKYLEQEGYVVNTATEDDSPSKADGYDLVLLSSTADPREVADKYARISVPVFTWNTVDYPDMRMTGPERHVDFETLDPEQDYARAFSVLYGYFPNSTDPIVLQFGGKSQMFGTLYLEPQSFGWGKPAASSDIVVNIEGDRTHAAVFTYEKGATMYDGFVAPARRVGFYLQDSTFHFLTAVHGPAEKDPALADWWVGLKLFDATLRWALSPPLLPAAYDPAATKAALAQAAKGKKVLFVRRLNTPEGEESDDHIAEHLKDVGFIVKQVDQTTPDTAADGEDFILISATNSKYKMADKYWNAKIPLMCLEGLMADTLKMADRHRYVDYGEHGEPKESDDPPEDYLEIVNSSHPMAAGLKNGYVKFIREPDVLKWAYPPPSAIVIATLP